MKLEGSKRNILKYIFIILLIASGIAAVVSGYNIIKYQIDKDKTNRNLNLIENSVVVNEEAEPEDRYAVDFKALKEQNEDVVAYLKEHRYLDDKRFLERAVEHYAKVKLYGRLRIKRELYAKGFSREDINGVDFDEYDIDFVKTCGERIEKTASRYKSRDALVAALARYGYTDSEIKSALSKQ